jgi:hypothetical protein
VIKREELRQSEQRISTNHCRSGIQLSIQSPSNRSNDPSSTFGRFGPIGCLLWNTYYFERDIDGFVEFDITIETNHNHHKTGVRMNVLSEIESIALNELRTTLKGELWHQMTPPTTQPGKLGMVQSTIARS